jgi:hypothetical protein
MSDERYVILHSDPHNLVIGQSSRELLFSLAEPDTLLAIVECPTFSVQRVYFDRWVMRPDRMPHGVPVPNPPTLILWGMSDRYDEAKRAGCSVLIATSWGDCEGYVRGSRPSKRRRRYTDDEGVEHVSEYTLWGTAEQLAACDDEVVA